MIWVWSICSHDNHEKSCLVKVVALSWEFLTFLCEYTSKTVRMFSWIQDICTVALRGYFKQYYLPYCILINAGYICKVRFISPWYILYLTSATSIFLHKYIFLRNFFLFDIYFSREEYLFCKLWPALFVIISHDWNENKYMKEDENF